MNKITAEELEDVYDNRFSTRNEEWKKLRGSFIDQGLETLLSEDVDNLTFHVIYLKITSLSDDEVFEHLLEEI